MSRKMKASKPLLFLLLLTSIYIAACSPDLGATPTEVLPEEPPTDVEQQPAQDNGEEATCASVPPSLVGWWPGDGDAIDAAADNHGTLVGETEFAPGILEQAFLFPNLSKTAPDFLGTDWIGIPDSSSWDFGAAPFSIVLWVNFSNVISPIPNQQPLVGHTDGPGETNKWILWLQDGDLTFHINTPTEPGLNLVSYQWGPLADRWYQVAVTREGSTWKLYVDGREVASETSTVLVPDANTELTIGRAEDTWLEGLIDEVEIYDSALTSDEIREAFDVPAPGKCKPGNR